MEKITCICYGKEHKFDTRKEAIEFFIVCASASEGSERERYMNILLDLDQGKTICYDRG